MDSTNTEAYTEARARVSGIEPNVIMAEIADGNVRLANTCPNKFERDLYPRADIDARRLAACWNACLGMPLEDVEALAAIDKGVMRLTVQADDYRHEAMALRARIADPDHWPMQIGTNAVLAGKLLGEMLDMAHAGDAQENEDWAAIMQDAEVLVKRQAPINRGLERRIAITGARTTIETLAHMYQGGTDTKMPRWDTSVLAVTVAEPERVSQIKAIADAEKFLRDLGMVQNPIEGQPTIICFDDVAIYRWTEETA